MSHTSRQSKFTFIHNSDLSGDVTIVNHQTEERFEVNGEDLVAFVVEYLQMEMVSSIEQMSKEQFIKAFITKQ